MRGGQERCWGKDVIDNNKVGLMMRERVETKACEGSSYTDTEWTDSNFTKKDNLCSSELYSSEIKIFILDSDVFRKSHKQIQLLFVAAPSFSFTCLHMKSKVGRKSERYFKSTLRLKVYS